MRANQLPPVAYVLQFKYVLTNYFTKHQSQQTIINQVNKTLSIAQKITLRPIISLWLIRESQ